MYIEIHLIDLTLAVLKLPANFNSMPTFLAIQYIKITDNQNLIMHTYNIIIIELLASNSPLI